MEYFLLCVVLLQQTSHIELEITQLARRRVQVHSLLLVLIHYLAEYDAIFFQLCFFINDELL